MRGRACRNLRKCPWYHSSSSRCVISLVALACCPIHCWASICSHEPLLLALQRAAQARSFWSSSARVCTPGLLQQPLQLRLLELLVQLSWTCWKPSGGIVLRASLTDHFRLDELPQQNVASASGVCGADAGERVGIVAVGRQVGDRLLDLLDKLLPLLRDFLGGKPLVDDRSIMS